LVVPVDYDWLVLHSDKKSKITIDKYGHLELYQEPNIEKVNSQ